MHSSRMRTIRCSGRLRGVCLGRCLPRGVSAWGCLPRGVCPGGVWQTTAPVNRITDRCKTLPCRNYVVDSKNWLDCTKSCINIEPSGFPPIREIREFRENFEDFFQSGKSGKNRGFSAKIREKKFQIKELFSKPFSNLLNL